MTKTLLRDLIKYAPSKFLPAISGVITIPIISRLFSPEEYGGYVLAVSLCSFLFAVSCSGFGAGALRFYAEYKKRSELGRYYFALNFDILAAVIFVSTCSFFTLSIIKVSLSHTLYRLFVICILVFMTQAIFSTYLQVLRAQEKSGTYTAFDLFTRYGSLGCGLLLVLTFDFDIDGLLWGEFFSALIVIPILFYVVTKGSSSVTWKNFSLEDTKHILSYAWPLGLGNIAAWGLNLSDRWIIGLYRPGNEIGLYSMAYQISDKSISIIVAVFLLSMGPLIINCWESQGRQAAEGALTAATRFFLTCCLPACIGLTILARPIIRILTSDSYYDGYRIFGYVAFAGLFYGLSQIAALGLILGKKTRPIAVNQFVATAVNLGLNFIFVPKFGFVAAGITALVGFILLFALQMYQSRKVLMWHFPFKTLRNVIFSSCIMGVTTYGIIGLANDTRISQISFILLGITLSVLVYFGSLFLLGETTKEELAKAGILNSKLIT